MDFRHGSWYREDVYELLRHLETTCWPRFEAKPLLFGLAPSQQLDRLGLEPAERVDGQGADHGFLLLPAVRPLRQG